MPPVLADLTKTIDVGASEVVNRPDFVFLCGGPIADKGSTKSARDFFFRSVAKQKVFDGRILLAERVNRWFENQELFPDLLELEDHIAELAALIVLFVEGPGSLAELGAFAARQELASKTTVILNLTHPQEKTFVADGPVRAINRTDEELVHYYEWDERRPASSKALKEFRTMTTEISRFVQGRLEGMPHSETLQLERRSHQLLVVSDLVEVAGATTVGELTEALGTLGLPTSRNALEKQLYLLQQLRLVRRIPVSNQKILTAGKASRRFVSYGFAPNAPTRDMTRIVSELRSGLSGAKARAWRRAQQMNKEPGP